MDKVKTVAPVAHDNRKADLTEWVAYNAGNLANHHLVCTGTTGRLVEIKNRLLKGGSCNYMLETQGLLKLKIF